MHSSIAENMIVAEMNSFYNLTLHYFHSIMPLAWSNSGCPSDTSVSCRLNCRDAPRRMR